MPEAASFSRRAFLARAGVIGAVVAVAGGGIAAARGRVTGFPVWAANPPTTAPLDGNAVLEGLVNVLRPALDFLASDTLSGLSAFSMPGPDLYSRQQGTPSTTAGGIQARGPAFLADALDRFVPFPNELARPLAAAFSTALADLHLPLPNPVQLLPTQLVDNVDAALQFLLNNDQTIPLSVAIAALLNLLATQVEPSSTLTPGPDMAPFSRLSFAQKAQAFALLEGAESNLVQALDLQLPEPLRDTASGLLKFVGGSLLEFASFGNYGEWGVFNATTKTVTAQPVGWKIAGYQPNGVGDGWDELKGYYQNRRMVTDV